MYAAAQVMEPRASSSSSPPSRASELPAPPVNTEDQWAGVRAPGAGLRAPVPKISLLDALCGETFDKLMLFVDGICTARFA